LVQEVCEVVAAGEGLRVSSEDYGTHVFVGICGNECGGECCIHAGGQRIALGGALDAYGANAIGGRGFNMRVGGHGHHDVSLRGRSLAWQALLAGRWMRGRVAA
jgi:hypothetical protein